MNLTDKQVQWACIVIGATAYFFLGALTEVAVVLQFGTFVGIAVVAPAVVTRTVSFQQPPIETDGSGAADGTEDSESEYKY